LSGIPFFFFFEKKEGPNRYHPEILQNAPNRIGMTRLSGLLVLLLLYGVLVLVLVLVLLMLCALACDIGCWWVAWATPGLSTDVLMGDTSDCNS
jgi:hypothetical protein